MEKVFIVGNFSKESEASFLVREKKLESMGYRPLNSYKLVKELKKKNMKQSEITRTLLTKLLDSDLTSTVDEVEALGVFGKTLKNLAILLNLNEVDVKLLNPYW